MSTKNVLSGQSISNDQPLSSQNNSQSGKAKGFSSRIKSVDPADTTFARFDGDPPRST
jgi:hypothetical protein